MVDHGFVIDLAGIGDSDLAIAVDGKCPAPGAVAAGDRETFDGGRIKGRRDRTNHCRSRCVFGNRERLVRGNDRGFGHIGQIDRDGRCVEVPEHVGGMDREGEHGRRLEIELGDSVDRDLAGGVDLERPGSGSVAGRDAVSDRIARRGVGIRCRQRRSDVCVVGGVFWKAKGVGFRVEHRVGIGDDIDGDALGGACQAVGVGRRDLQGKHTGASDLAGIDHGDVTRAVNRKGARAGTIAASDLVRRDGIPSVGVGGRDRATHHGCPIGGADNQ